VQGEGCLPQVLQGPRLAQSGELLEYFADVVGDFFIAGQQAEIGIEASGTRVIVAGAEVGIANEAAFFAADDEQGLGVSFVADHAINHMGADFFQFGGPTDIGFFVKACHQLDNDGDFLAALGGADQRLHQYRVGAGAVHRHLDCHDMRVIGRLVEEFDYRGEGLVGVVQQDIVAPDAVKDVGALADGLGQSLHKGRKFHVRAVYPVRHLHQTDQVDRAFDAIEVGMGQSELGEQEVGHCRRAVFGYFEADGVTEVAVRQFALQFGAQIGDFFFVNERGRSCAWRGTGSSRARSCR
jgi:hypothetical protein